MKKRMHGWMGWLLAVAILLGLALYLALSRERPGMSASAVLQPEMTLDDTPATPVGVEDPGPANPPEPSALIGRRAAPALQSDQEPEPSRSLSVISAHGIKVNYVWLVTADGNLRRALDPEGRLTGHLPPTTFRIRAPGHLEASVPPEAVEVRLEADCLLTLGLQGVEHLKPDFVVYPDFAGSEQGNAPTWAAYSRTDGGQSWSLAVDVDVLRSRHAGSVDVEVLLTGGRALEVSLEPFSGMRATHNLPTLSLLELAPLVIELPGDGGAENVLTLHDISRQRLLSRESMTWGNVSLYGVAFAREITFTGPRTKFEAVPVGIDYVAEVRQPESGAHGCAEFVHTGASQWIDLQPGVRVLGLLLSDDGSSLEGASIAWDFVEEKDEVLWRGPWAGRSDAIELGLGSEFALGLPTRVPCPNEVPGEMPPTLWLRFAAPFHDPVVQARTVRIGAEVDLGEVVLSKRDPPITIVGDHGLVADQLRYQSIRVLDVDGETWSFEVRNALQEPGVLRLWLERSLYGKETGTDLFLAHPLGGTRSERRWPNPPPSALVLTRDGGEGHCFSLAPDGTYRPEDMRWVSVTIDVHEPLESDLLFGWSWRDVRHSVIRIPAATTGPAGDHDVLVPSLGGTFWWRWQSGDDLVMQEKAMDGEPVHIVVQ